MIQGNPHKRMLKFETTIDETDKSPFPKRTVTPLNEIRSSDLEFGNDETLQIVDDEIKVVPRPAAPVIVPESVTRIQMRDVLVRQGLMVLIEGAIEAMPEATDEEKLDKDLMKEWWNNAPVIRRHNPRVLVMATALAFNDAVVDQLFIDAAQVV